MLDVSNGKSFWKNCSARDCCEHEVYCKITFRWMLRTSFAMLSPVNMRWTSFAEVLGVLMPSEVYDLVSTADTSRCSFSSRHSHSPVDVGAPD